MATLPTQWQRIQSSIWLVCGVLCLFFALVFWAMTDKQKLVEVVKEPESEAEIQIQPEKVAATTHLGALLDEVKPLELTTRITASGTHEAEFRGTKFITDNKKNSTIELFRASEENVIKNYIKKQSDRNNLVYIRLSGEDQQEKYVLLYGNYKNNNEAKVALNQLNMSLPASLKPSVHSFSEYESYVNDLGSEEMGVSGKLREVKLAPAALPRISEADVAQARAARAAIQPNVATTTTETRRDQNGNVVDVKKSQTEVPLTQNPKPNSE